MLNRVLIAWIVFAGVMGFAVGGSFVAAYQIPLSRHETSANPEQSAADQIAKEKVAEHNTKIESLWVPTDSVGLYTLVLAVFTGLLVAVSAGQGYFLLRADKTARIVATAADLSARAAVGIQLPIVRAYAGEFVVMDKPDAHGGTIVDDPTGSAYAKLYRMRFANIGKSTAYPSEFGFGWTHKELPPEPVYEAVFFCDPAQIIAENDDFSPALDTFVLSFSPEVRASFRSGQSILRIFAYIKYADFLENAHETRYCWRIKARYGLVREHEAPPAYTRKT
jgi:hypothetical protein